MEDTKCILCGRDAQRKVYSSKYRDDVGRVNEAGGYCYDCPDCGSYCLDNYEHSWVTKFASDKQKETLSEYVKTHQLEDEFLPVTWDDIKRILGLPSKKKT